MKNEFGDHVIYTDAYRVDHCGHKSHRHRRILLEG